MSDRMHGFNSDFIVSFVYCFVSKYDVNFGKYLSFMSFEKYVYSFVFELNVL